MRTCLQFTKMSGAGNDFVVIDNRDGRIRTDKSALSRALCSRHFGVGADGLLLVEASAMADFTMLYFNADGSHGGMCGNGGRCIARYALFNDIAREQMTFEALNHIYAAIVLDSSVKLRMKEPKFFKKNILIDLRSEQLSVISLDTGSPHVVIERPDLDGVDVEGIGRRIRFLKECFPDGTNVNFIRVVGKNCLRMRTYERGVEAETLACGTGAVASSIVVSLLHGMESPVTVQVRSGEELLVHFSRRDDTFSDVYLEGSAHFLFSGELLYDTESERIVDSVPSKTASFH